MSQSDAQATGSISRSNCMVNSSLTRSGMKNWRMFGSPETTTGGNALPNYLFASVRLDIRRIGALKDRDEVVARHTGLQSQFKNKVAAPFKQVEFRTSLYGKAILRWRPNCWDLGVKAAWSINRGLVVQHNGDERIGPGRENCQDLPRRETSPWPMRSEDKIRAAHGLDFAGSRQRWTRTF